MPVAIEADEPPHPEGIGLLGTRGIVSHAQLRAQGGQQCGLRPRRRGGEAGTRAWRTEPGCAELHDSTLTVALPIRGSETREAIQHRWSSVPEHCGVDREIAGPDPKNRAADPRKDA